MESQWVEIVVRLRLPLDLVNDLDAQANREHKAIDDMLTSMLIDAMTERKAYASAMQESALEHVRSHGGDFIPNPGDGSGLVKPS